MTFAAVLGLVLQASLFLLVFAIGLESSLRDFNHLFSHPRPLARAVFSMNIVMLVFAIAVGLAFDMHPAVKIALIAIAMSPVPPLLARKKEGAPGEGDYMLCLISAAAAAAIVIIPLTLELIQWLFGPALHMPIGKVFSIVFISLFAPLGAGMLLRYFSPALAVRIAPHIARIGTIVLLVVLLPILFVSARTIVTLVGNGVLIFPILFAVVGLAAGHLLGGPDPANRAALAVATARRHPGMAIAIASINYPDQKAVPAVVVCCLLFGALLSIAYTRWWLRSDRVTPPLPKYS